MATHALTLMEKYFDLIKNGRKSWEGRTFSGTSASINKDDMLLFSINPSSASSPQRLDERLLTRVEEMQRYPSFRDMLLDQGVEAFLPLDDDDVSNGKHVLSIDQAVDLYRSFPSYSERERLYGAVAFRIQLLKPESL
jgi:ASC-1-like (ASCH) protein